jgi:hypothetical protein
MANNFPNLRPTLNLDLVNGINVDPRITFTRAGTRTYYGQEVVKAEENLFQQTGDLSNVYWSKTNVTVASAVGPEGLSNAFLVYPTTTGTFRMVGTTNAGFLAAVRPLDNTIQIEATAAGKSFIGFTDSNAGQIRANFDVSTGALGTVAAGYTATITPTSAGFFKCIVSKVGGWGASATPFFTVQDANGSTTATTSGTDGIIVLRPQIENRLFATAYTATTTQPITRYQRQLKTAAVNEWPREFDPVTGECLGRSVWESRTNLLQRSEEFDNAYWTKVGATVSANQVIAPDGTLSMDKLVEDTANSGHSVQGTGVSVTSGIVYTFTIYAKAAERSFIRINGNSTGLVGAAYYNLSTGALGTVTAGTTASIVNVGNGIYRCVFTRTSTATTNVNFLVSVTNADNTSSYTGDGYSGIYIWGAQLEAGAFATPYIPTVAAQVTRVADSAEITGVNFSSWFRQDEGSFFVDSTNSGTFGIPINIHDGTANNQYQVLTGTSGTAFLVTTANVVQANFGTRATPAKTSASYKFNDFMASTNGSVPATDTSGTLPVVSVARIGSRYDNSSHINGYIKRLTYYPQALTSANLTAVTR